MFYYVQLKNTFFQCVRIRVDTYITPELVDLSNISDLNASFGNSGSSKCSNNSLTTFSTFCLSDQSPSKVKLRVRNQK